MHDSDDDPARTTTMQRQWRQQRRANDGGGGGRTPTTGTSTSVDDDDDDDDVSEGGGDHWLRSRAPHRARVGSDYQVAELPPCAPGAVAAVAVPARDGAAAVVAGARPCVSPTVGSGH